MDKDVDKILNSLDGISSAEPSPYFYSKLIGRISKAEKNIWEKWSGFIARPVVLIAGFILVVILNVATIITSGKQKSFSQQGGINVEEYEQLSYSTSTFFDDENGTP